MTNELKNYSLIRELIERQDIYHRELVIAQDVEWARELAEFSLDMEKHLVKSLRDIKQLEAVREAIGAKDDIQMLFTEVKEDERILQNPVYRFFNNAYCYISSLLHRHNN